MAQYRWIAGHQLAFCLWRRLAEALEPLTRGELELRTIARAAVLYDAYSVLLLYCGSCSPATYSDVIQPHMMGANPAFSGRWARDFQRIGPMMRTLRTADAPDSLDDVFTAAADNDRIHQAVAIRLIPGGHSLLRSSGRDAEAPPTAEEHDLYDAFFGVEDERLPHQDTPALLRKRLVAVRSDLLAEPLPVPCGWEGLSLSDIALVERFHRDSIAILDHVEEIVNE